MTRMLIGEMPMGELAELIRFQLANGGVANLVVKGSSTAPMLHNGRDSVTLTPPAGPVKRGDVILYQRENGRYVLHRVIRCREDGLLCCGGGSWRCAARWGK